MKRLNYFKVHKNKKAKKLTYYFSKEAFKKVCDKIGFDFDKYLTALKNYKL